MKRSRSCQRCMESDWLPKVTGWWWSGGGDEYGTWGWFSCLFLPFSFLETSANNNNTDCVPGSLCDLCVTSRVHGVCAMITAQTQKEKWTLIGHFCPQGLSSPTLPLLPPSLSPSPRHLQCRYPPPLIAVNPRPGSPLLPGGVIVTLTFTWRGHT